MSSSVTALANGLTMRSRRLFLGDTTEVVALELHLFRGLRDLLHCWILRQRLIEPREPRSRPARPLPGAPRGRPRTPACPPRSGRSASRRRPEALRRRARRPRVSARAGLRRHAPQAVPARSRSSSETRPARSRTRPEPSARTPASTTCLRLRRGARGGCPRAPRTGDDGAGQQSTTRHIRSLGEERPAVSRPLQPSL